MQVKLDDTVVGKVVKGVNKCWVGIDLTGKVLTHWEPTRKKAIDSLLKELCRPRCVMDEKTARKRQNTLERAFWKCNNIGEDVIATTVLTEYKIFKDCTDEEIDAMANYIEERMGFGKNLLTKDQEITLIIGGFFESNV